MRVELWSVTVPIPTPAENRAQQGYDPDEKAFVDHLMKATDFAWRDAIPSR